jgi:hypothetical protein
LGVQLEAFTGSQLGHLQNVGSGDDYDVPHVIGVVVVEQRYDQAALLIS